MIKKHWPLFFAALMVIFSIIAAIAASHSTDTGVAIAAGVIIFMFLLPLAGAVIGAWYGWRLRSPLKWLLIPASFLGIFVYLLVWDLTSSSGLSGMDAYPSIGAFTGIACLVAEVIAAAIARLVRRYRTDRNEKETEE